MGHGGMDGDDKEFVGMTGMRTSNYTVSYLFALRYLRNKRAI